jgi:hypothetical protein
MDRDRWGVQSVGGSHIKQASLSVMKTIETKLAPEKAFTRTELIFCVTTCLLLIGLAAPAFGRGDTGSEVIGCLANKQKLINAWSAFIVDHEGKLPGKHTITQQTPSPIEPWVSGTMSWDISPDVTNVTRLNTRRNSSLSVYLGGNVEAFRCPTDIYVSAQQRAAGSKRRGQCLNWRG